MRTCSCLIVALAAALGASAAEPAEAPKAQLPNLRLDVKSKTIEIDGKFCIGEYPLELFACQKELRDYESMVSSPCQRSSPSASSPASATRRTPRGSSARATPSTSASASSATARPSPSSPAS